MERFKFLSKRKTNNLPGTTGVYCFKKGKELIYIGKAVNIKDRVKNHFSQPSYRDGLFIDKIDKIGYFETGSEIEALILEANLIKKYQPKYNVMWRDDKNYFYVAITRDKLPYIYITHQQKQNAIYIGPFIDGKSLKKTLRFLRRAFPYYTAKKHSKNKCAYCHLDLCPGPNPGLSDYKKNIKKLILILKGKRNAVLNSLKKEMKRLSKENKYEEAAKIRDKIYALAQVMSHANVINNDKELEGSSLQWPKTQGILQGLLGIKKPISRIEAYDISNIQGKQATGAVVVFIGGKPDKNSYRKFRIRLKQEPNDTAMLKETLERRFKHKEWPYPELVLIDGGKAQLNAVIKTKGQKPKTKNIKVMALAKRNNELYIEGRKNPILLKTLPREVFNLILQLRDESHRFAKSYHVKLRKDSLLI